MKDSDDNHRHHHPLLKELRQAKKATKIRRQTTRIRKQNRMIMILVTGGKKD